MTIPRWNSGRAVGPRTAFTQDQIAMLIGRLEHQKSSHDLALLTVGIDTMLRASDLLCLKVQDIAFGDRTIRTVTCHEKFPPLGARVRPEKGTDDEAIKIFGRADHWDFARA